jgi:hypothetical protein
MEFNNSYLKKYIIDGYNNNKEVMIYAYTKELKY